MGGKKKHPLRTKSNTKPSSSSRSAELLGFSGSNYVGFSAHSDLSLVPLAPGLGTSDQMLELFDSSISPEFQTVFRKMSKKDPITKVKGLHEFIGLVNSSELSMVKTILPLWPRFYQNFATDLEHNVREATQSAHQLISFKCKKAVAPYLKQIVPVWLASRFDNYAAAANIARNSFSNIFEGNVNRTQEVCLHCQAEIINYVNRNITSPVDSFPNAKSLSKHEAEQKYSRNLLWSLKLLAFFIDETETASNLSQFQSDFGSLIENTKFWNCSINKNPAVRAAWFEAIQHILQSKRFIDIMAKHKLRLISVCFQSCDDSNRLNGPYVWGCILQIMSIYEDWFQAVHFKESFMPRLKSMIQNNFNRNAVGVAPYILPFLSMLSQGSLHTLEYFEFCKEIANDFKIGIRKRNVHGEEEYNAIIKAYCECLRFLFEKCNSTAEQEMGDIYAIELLEDNIIDLLEWFLKYEINYSQLFFLHCAALISFLAKHRNESKFLYKKLLEIILNKISHFIKQIVEERNIDECFLQHTIEFMQYLKIKGEATFADNDIRAMSSQLVRFCLYKVLNKHSFEYVNHLQKLTKMYSDPDFYEMFTDEKSLCATLMRFIELFDRSCEASYDVVLDMIFDVLLKLDESSRFSFIDAYLLKIPRPKIQLLILQRLLCFPIIAESEVRQILSRPESCDIIGSLAQVAANENSNEKLSLIHKCFIQNDSGEILIPSTTVDVILNIFLAKLTEPNYMMNTCEVFTAEIFSVACSNNNASKSVLHNVFLKLFELSIHGWNYNSLSEDSHREITKCWQDALCSTSFGHDAYLIIKCIEIADESLYSQNLTSAHIEFISEAMTKVIICSSYHINNEDGRNQFFDTIFKSFSLNIESKTAQNRFFEFCLFHECTIGLLALGTELAENFPKCLDFTHIIARAILHLSTILKLITHSKFIHSSTDVKGDTDNELENQPCTIDLVVLAPSLLDQLLNCIYVASAGDSLFRTDFELNATTKTLITTLSTMVAILTQEKLELADKLKNRMLVEAIKDQNATVCRSLLYLKQFEYATFEENSAEILAKELTETFLTNKSLKAYIYSVQFLLPRLTPKTITLNSLKMHTDTDITWMRASMFRCLIKNNFDAPVNDINDKLIISAALHLITEISEKQHTQTNSLLYNTPIYERSFAEVIDVVEYINLLMDVVTRFAQEMTVKNWDAVRIGLSCWALSISKSIHCYSDVKTALFIIRIFKLYGALMKFILSEKSRSSTLHTKTMIEEWENIFAHDVNVVLFSSFYMLCNFQNLEEGKSECLTILLRRIMPDVELLDYKIIYNFCYSSKKITLDDALKVLLKNLSQSCHFLRTSSVSIIKKLTPFFVAKDKKDLEENSYPIDEKQQSTKWQYLKGFEEYMQRYDRIMSKYLDGFSFKVTEISGLDPIDRSEEFSYLLLWDIIIYACSISPAVVRSSYTSWIQKNKYEKNFLHFLFRGMPEEILKNHDSKKMQSDVFKGLIWSQITDRNLSMEKYVCHLYTEVLRKLPVVVRKWWNECPARQKTFVDKLTSTFVSPLICTEELKTICSKKDKQYNMQIKVHTSTREVIAMYTIDEACIELCVTLPHNHPLGIVKVANCGRDIGGRSLLRNVGMQLTIFLTHQNGTICDGLALWKSNLDKKFEGVEECFVCYTIIHQDTCQLPKLSCRTCKKKFHGTCLYKWFTSSTKSTCPICRNVF